MKLTSIVLSSLIVACSSSPDSNDSGAKDSSADVVGAFDAAPIEGGNDSGQDCTAVLGQLLSPIDSVSTGDLTILSNANGVLTLYVDASAGGPMVAPMNPRIYVALDGTKAMVTDKAAKTSMAWDLAIKRPLLFTNSGHGGSGQGGTVLVAKDFDVVTASDAAGKTFKSEVFVDESCNPKMDATGAVLTSFDGWYDYNQQTNQLTPHPGTWLVKSATGKLYKLQILGYYATPDGGMGMSGGRYTMKVAAL